MPPHLRVLIDRWKAAQIPRKTAQFLRRHYIATAALVSVMVLALVGAAALQRKCGRMVEERLSHGSLRTNSQIYAAPRLIGTGDALTPSDLVARLQRAGYTERAGNPVGHYSLEPNSVSITTGPESYFEPHSVRIDFRDQQIERMESLTEKRQIKSWWLEPELITSVLDETRGKRRPVPFSEYPSHVVQAVVSVEDKRFFQHGGLDLIRAAKAAYVDVREGRKEQGASTITMQLARSFWLDPDKNWTRKLTEIFIAEELERRFTKEQIFEMYANEVYLGRRGSYSVHGFGEAAHSYLGKDLRNLTLPEAAMLAGIIQRPSYYNPFRYPERVKDRRDIVLTLMHNNGYIDAARMAAAKKAPVELSPGETESSEAPYFVDLVNGELQEQFEKWDFEKNAYRIYSTLDLDLQQAAVEAIQKNLGSWQKRMGKKRAVPQIALVALDAHTGAIKALVGGRNYAESQLNRVFARRPPGSTFKPFVYAAALNARGGKFTAGNAFLDEPTIFTFNHQPYEPANFGEKYMGRVTVRTALMHSLNIPVIKTAEQIRFRPVVEIAKAAGVTTPLQGTPSLALGSYEVPPIELAEAYTIFSNGGVHIKRNWVNTIRDGANKVVYTNQPETNRVLDERVAYIMTNLMEDVVRAGSAGGVRARGFVVPAAGKTGTARDGWFAGYTSKLVAVVWVGYDDYSDLDLEGSKSALPIWTEFMKNAHKLREYRDAKPFKQPPGIISVSIDSETGLLPGEYCEKIHTELFIDGTEPKEQCEDPHIPEEFPAETLSLEGKQHKSVFGRVLDVFR